MHYKIVTEIREREPCQTLGMKLFCILASHLLPFTVLAKASIFDVWWSSECTSGNQTVAMFMDSAFASYKFAVIIDSILIDINTECGLKL